MPCRRFHPTGLEERGRRDLHPGLDRGQTTMKTTLSTISLAVAVATGLAAPAFAGGDVIY